MTETQTTNRPSPRFRGRLMLCNVGRVGDTILRNSILDSAFRTYERVDYIGGPSNAELLRSDPRLNKVIILRNTFAGFAGLLKAALRHRYEGFIELKDHWSRTSYFVSRLFRCQVKTGWNTDRWHPFNRDIRSVYVPDAHKMETMRRIGNLAGLEPGEYKPTLVLTSDSISWFQQNYAWEKPFIFLNISATAEDRMWPVKHWAQYVQSCGLAGEPILVNGVPGDREQVLELCSKLPFSVQFKPRQFMDVAAALVNAKLVLTVDTGVVHACSALNKPIVALSHSGNEYGPLSTRKLVIEAKGGTVSQIEPEQAIALTLKHGLP
jgi:ADP-heptose:LPS heptosyltransferase